MRTNAVKLFPADLNSQQLSPSTSLNLKVQNGEKQNHLSKFSFKEKRQALPVLSCQLFC